MVEFEKTEPLGYKQAWTVSPGPDSLVQSLVLLLKGVLMGAADIVPGVSGGTMAFITGIYDNLVDAVRSFNLDFIRYFFTLNFKKALATAHLRFLLPLGIGILFSLVTMSRVIHYFMVHNPAQLYGFFFGMILASVIVVARGVWPFDFKSVASALLAFLLSFYIAGVVPATTPNALWFVFLCGCVAICAMILPGISGAFILLLLGKYQFITGALKNPFADGNILVLAVFACGCVIGLAGFSRILHFFLTRHRAVTISALAGFMAGGLRKIWPYKEIVDTSVINGKLVVLRDANIFPPAYDQAFFVIAGLAVAGFLCVLAIEKAAMRAN